MKIKSEVTIELISEHRKKYQAIFTFGSENANINVALPLGVQWMILLKCLKQ